MFPQLELAEKKAIALEVAAQSHEHDLQVQAADLQTEARDKLDDACEELNVLTATIDEVRGGAQERMVKFFYNYFSWSKRWRRQRRSWNQ